MQINPKKVLLLSSVMGLFLSGCAIAQESPTQTKQPTTPTTQPTAPTASPTKGNGKTPAPQFTTDKGVSFKVDERGAMIPVAADGTPFATCGTLDDNTCSLFKKGITINKMERINITKIEHQINPTCLLYIINMNGVDYVWYDKTNPNCAKYNK
ncbi:MAG: hypothetical protein U5M23_10320 [Marinagarivorans sp.]|nr:hypothetical protein [Marinagarivorans sp.]